MTIGRRPWCRAGTLVLCLLLAPGAQISAFGQLPGFLPFRSIEAEGTLASITVAGGDLYFRLGFDADYRLDPQSDGIGQGDDVHIITSVAYPVPIPGETQDLAVNRLVVRLSVTGGCFESRGRSLVFRAPDRDAIPGCAEARIQILDAEGSSLFDGDFDRGLRTVTIELAPVGRRGRWKLRSAAAFDNPGFPFPVVGYGYDEAGNRISGVTLIVGNDGGLSPFSTVAFRTLAP